ncbi:MAG TPA: hypothetical protein VKO86_10005 [Gemmatimonadales bacterium]|nr:hypothetical protein [Gemmatimonadales bacterium]
MARNARTVGWLVSSALGVSAWACGGGGGGTTPPPPGPTCSTAAGQSVTLGAGTYQAIPPVPSAGCLILPGNASTTDSTRYLLAAQIATDVEGATAPFILDGDTVHPALMAASVSPLSAGGLGVGERFHDFLRQQERTHFAGLTLAPPTAAAGQAAPASIAAPPTVGSSRTFKVCSNLTCSSTATVTATAKTVNGHLAIYVDNNAPANGLTQTDLDSLGALFDTRLYAIDTTAFGRESDIDTNSVVIVLMTNVVNQLVTKTVCKTQGFVAGFFFGADIDPQFASSYNHGEIFYSIVADPDSTLSCAHSVARLKSLVPVTFIHEFQHMISYNQHVLVRGGSPQVTWLDEGMSHFAEELGGRSFLPTDQASFSNFVIGDLINSYFYLDSTATHFLAFSSGIGTLSERGAAWLLMRYMADQYAADTSFTSIAAFTRSIELNSLQGAPAIANVTGTPFATIVERWALANYVSDLPGFAAPPELQYKSWHFRTTFASLNQQAPSIFAKPFPLTPPLTAGSAVSISGTLHAGSANYALAFQPPSGAGFDLLFSGPNGAALLGSNVPRLNVIRIH